MSSPIRIVDYDPKWPSMYEMEEELILSTVGRVVIELEHVGSTAVPGLGAKPIIDIMAAVRRIDDAVEIIEPLAAIGYEYVAEYEEFVPERRYFRKGAPEPASHHLHVVEPTTHFWKDHLLLRDYLRAAPEEARAYQAFKRDLARKITQDRVAFTDAKTSFIESALERARSWRDGR